MIWTWQVPTDWLFPQCYIHAQCVPKLNRKGIFLTWTFCLKPCHNKLTYHVWEGSHLGPTYIIHYVYILNWYTFLTHTLHTRHTLHTPFPWWRSPKISMYYVGRHPCTFWVSYQTCCDRMSILPSHQCSFWDLVVVLNGGIHYLWNLWGIFGSRSTSSCVSAGVSGVNSLFFTRRTRSLSLLSIFVDVIKSVVDTVDDVNTRWGKKKSEVFTAIGVITFVKIFVRVFTDREVGVMSRCLESKTSCWKTYVCTGKVCMEYLCLLLKCDKYVQSIWILIITTHL